MTTDGDGGSSFVRRWQLAEMLKNFREAAGMTQTGAITALRQLGEGRWSGPKLSRVENREQAIRTSEVAQLLELYGVPEAERPAVLDLAERARERDWRPTYGVDLHEPLRGLISLEAGATVIRKFVTMVVPGLLQTPDYARSVIEATTPAAGTSAELEKMVARRITRQHVLRRDPPLAIHVVLDESVLDRVVGGRTVMRDQLRRLADLRDSGHVTLQVLPLAGGCGPGVHGPFTLIGLPSPAPDVLFGESPVAGDFYTTEVDRVCDCTLTFGMLSQLALSRDESADRIEAAARGFERP